jgi:phosphohistidine phosphatase
MKRIILVRHASAVRRHKAPDDFSRALRKRGRREAARMIEWAVGHLDAPDLLLTSPAARALETARIFAEGFAHPRRRIAVDPRIYDAAGPRDLLDVLRGLDDAAGSVMVFGHDPVFTEFASTMAPTFDEAVPKCGVVVLETRRRKWSALRPGDGLVSAFQHPKALEEESTA